MPRRTRAADGRSDPVGRSGSGGDPSSSAGDRLDVPGPRAVPSPDGVRKHRLRPAAPTTAPRGGRRGCGPPRRAAGVGRTRRPYARGPLRRREAKGGPGPHVGRASAGDPVRRALRIDRCRREGRTSCGVSPRAPYPRHHRPPRNARPGGGVLFGRPGRPAVRRAPRDVGHSQRRVRTTLGAASGPILGVQRPRRAHRSGGGGSGGPRGRPESIGEAGVSGRRLGNRRPGGDGDPAGAVRGAGRVARARALRPTSGRRVRGAHLATVSVVAVGDRPPPNGQKVGRARLSMNVPDPLHVAESIPLGASSARVFRVERVPGVDPARWARRPRTIRVLLENVVRHFDPHRSDLRAIVALANGETVDDRVEFLYYPERVLLQDFTGVPVIVDLATLRSAAVARGLPPERVNPAVRVDLIVDHSVQVDSFGSSRSYLINLDREYDRNHERYRFLQWAKTAYTNYHIVPPGNGICHQVNLEHLAEVVVRRGENGDAVAYPDTLLGTDSHTTMVNGLSVLGWGVGGIEAEAVMLGEPYTLPRPIVVGVELSGQLPAGATATDLVLTVTRLLRETGVVDQFVEYFGPGVTGLSVADRATISNMCPEYGATSAYFPIDEATIAYLRGTDRDPTLVSRVEAYARAQGLWGSPAPGTIDYDRVVRLDLSTVVPTISGP